MLQAAQPPILIDNGMAVLENDLIERHIMKKIPGGHNLFVPDQVSIDYKIETHCICFVRYGLDPSCVS